MLSRRSHGLRFSHGKRITSRLLAYRILRWLFWGNVVDLSRWFFDFFWFCWFRFFWIVATRSHLALRFTIILSPTLSSMCFIAPEVCDEDLRVGVHFPFHLLEKFNILIQLDIDDNLLILFRNCVTSHVLLNFYSCQIFSVIGNTISKSPHSMNFPLRLQLSGSFIFTVRFMEAEFSE